MYVAVVPNRGSPPAILLRESYREAGKTKNRTLANLSRWPAERIEQLRAVLRGDKLLPAAAAVEIVRALPHGHVLAALGTARRIALDAVLPRRAPQRRRDLALALIVARLLEPAAKLATARMLDPATASHSLGEMLGLGPVVAKEVYAALDWLGREQPFIEATLARRHLQDGALLLYDVTSTYLEGRCCELARHGYSRDHRGDRPQLVIGLMCAADRCPVAVEVFEGNTADPLTLSVQIDKLKQRFKLQRVVMVGDRGVLTSARIEQTLRPAGLDWITALRAPAIKQLAAAGGPLQPSLFDDRDIAEITSPDYPGERLVVCKNPLLAEERARKRAELLAATEKELARIAARVQRARSPLRGAAAIGQAVGAVLGRRHMAKHFQISITEDTFSFAQNPLSIAAEAALDGIYVVRTNLPAEHSDAAATVRAYKSLSGVEHAFRSLKTVDLELRCSIGPHRGCARTSCSACWPIICNGTCAAASPRCCSTSPIRPRVRHSAPRRWRRPSRHRRRNARPPANAPTRQMANRSRCTASTRCLAISPRSPAMSSASAAITSPPSSPPLPVHSTTPSICSGLPPPRRQTDPTHCKLDQWLALERGQSSA